MGAAGRHLDDAGPGEAGRGGECIMATGGAWLRQGIGRDTEAGLAREHTRGWSERRQGRAGVQFDWYIVGVQWAA